MVIGSLRGLVMCDTTNTNYECYKKLRLVAVMVAVAATTLATAIAVVATMLAATKW